MKYQAMGVRISLSPHKHIGLWCNGSTGDFDSPIVGSNPAGVAKFSAKVPKPRWEMRFAANTTRAGSVL